MKQCLRCEHEVTEKFHRTMSNNDGELWSCPRCQPRGKQLVSEDDDRSSQRYDRYLDEIQSGKTFKEIEGRS